MGTEVIPVSLSVPHQDTRGVNSTTERKCGVLDTTGKEECFGSFDLAIPDWKLVHHANYRNDSVEGKIM